MMDKKTPIDLYRALDEMKKISAGGGTFSLKFRKYDRQRRKGGDMARVQAARIRPKASDETVAHASYKLFFTDTESGLARVCWQPLIMEFNGRPVILN